MIKYYVYGIKQTDNYGVFTVEKKVKNPETGEYEVIECKYSRNKVGSAVLKAFATKALGLNLISQSANLVGGLANTAIIATGGNFFTLKQFAKAGQLISSGNFNPKVMAVMEYLNLRGDSDIYKRANQVSVNDTARKMDINKLFWLQEKADSLIFNNVGLALMMNFGVDKDGKVKRLDKLPAGTKSLLESIEVDKDGKLNLTTLLDENEFRKFKNKVGALTEKITGMSTRDNVSGYMSLQELIDGFQYLYDRIYATEVLRQRFQNAKEVLKDNMNAAMFAFRVNLDWQSVYQHLIQNLKELQTSGFYDEALKRYQQSKKSGKKVQLTPIEISS